MYGRPPHDLPQGLLLATQNGLGIHTKHLYTHTHTFISILRCFVGAHSRPSNLVVFHLHLI